MTLNLIINTMAVVDSEISDQGVRTSDNIDKSELFSCPSYHGVLLSNGNSYSHFLAVSFLRRSQEESLDVLMEKLRDFRNGSWEEKYERSIANLRQDIAAKYQLIPKEEERQNVIASKFTEEVDKIHAQIEQHNNARGALYVVAYDHTQQRIRKFHLPYDRRATLAYIDLVPAIADGSGGDLAGAYISTQTSGIDWQNLPPGYNFYLIALGCAAATANAGVGGFMRIATISKDNANYLDPIMVNAAVRICGKQIAGDISKQDAMQLVESLYQGNKEYGHIAKKLRITIDDLLYAPCSLHQDVSRFNALLHGQK